MRFFERPDFMPHDMFAGSKYDNDEPAMQTSVSETSQTPEVESNTSEIAAEEATNASSNYEGFENNFTEPTDYSWITQISVDSDDVEKSLEEKASDISTAEAKSGLSTELNDPLEHEKSKSELMEKEAVPFASPSDLEKGWKDTSKEGNTKEELEQAQKDFDKMTEGDLTPKQKRGVAEAAERYSQPETLSKVANALTLGVAPRINDIPNFDKVAYSSYVDRLYKEELKNAPSQEQAYRNAMRKAYKQIENAKLGLAKDAVDYWKETGDTLGNKYAEKAEQTVVDAIVACMNGKITEEQMNAIVDGVTNPSSSEQLMSLFTSPALTGLEIAAAAAVGGAAVGKLASVGANKLVQRMITHPTKLGDKILHKLANNPAVKQNFKYNTYSKVFEMEKNATAVSPETTARIERLQDFLAKNEKMYDKAFEDFVNKNPDALLKDWNAYANKVPELKEYKEAIQELTDITPSKFGKARQSVGKTELESAIKYAGSKSSELILKDVKSIQEAINSGIITASDVARAIVEGTNVKDTGKAAATGVVIGGAANEANAAPTGIFDEKGKMVDSKEIVAERKDKPYEGEDAVTIYSKEGKVTVSPREATIIGEAENLPPSSGYTDEVKEAAKGSEVYEQPEVQMVQPNIEDLSNWQKAGDIVQAILGGHDLNYDKTITKSEWYESTIGKIKNAFETSGKDDNIDKVGKKSIFEKASDKFTALIDNIGKSLPGVVNLKTGEAFINPELDRPNLDLSPEALRSTIETGVVDSLPNWGDSTSQELKKEIVSSAVNEAISSNVYGEFGPIVLAKAVGQYVTSTVSEIAHLYGHDLDNDTKGAINFIVTNAVGLPLEPVSTIVRDAGASLYGVATRSDIESVFENGPTSSSTFYIIPYKDGGTQPTTKSTYGVSSESDTAEGKYSGYVENAKNSNLATDYNQGMEKETNEAVSDMKVKIFSVYNNEPDYIKNAIGKILKSFRENY